MPPIKSSLELDFKKNISDALMSVLYASFTILNLDVSGVIVMAFIVALIMMINYDPSNRVGYLHLDLFSGYMFIFALFSLISSLWAIVPEYAVEKTITLFLILICFTVLYSVYYYAKIERLLNIIMYGGLMVAYYTIIFYGVNNIQDTLSSESRLDTVFANVNVIGTVCGTSFILAFYFFRRNKNILNLVLSIPAIIVVAGTGSKKALIMLVIGVVYVEIFRTSKKRSNNILKIIGSIISLVLIFIVLMKSGVFSGTLMRMDGMMASITGDGEVDSSTALRSLYRALGYAQLFDTPLLGLGMGNARILAYKASGHDCYLHDNFAEMAANGGIIGFILYYWIYFYILKKEYKHRKANPLSSIVLFLVIINLVMDFGGVSYYSKTTYLFLMVEMLHINKLKNKYEKGKNIFSHP